MAIWATLTCVSKNGRKHGFGHFFVKILTHFRMPAGRCLLGGRYRMAAQVRHPTSTATRRPDPLSSTPRLAQRQRPKKAHATGGSPPPDQGHSRIARRNQTDRANPARPHLPRPQPQGNRSPNRPAYASGSSDRSKGAQTCRLAPAPPSRRNSPCDPRSHPNTHDRSADDPTADNPARSTPRCDGCGRARHSSGQSPRAACECGYPESYSCDVAPCA